eukprot:TRINITY_DN2550_c0_g1_i1.p1 TRINITY_DN2550_c0_g1~~TRINITY_DN2550_c0_g1_i1.p1  ORF type:complete len:355 (-),score=134.62 TRINITY_DN2550_c0_g1_i1:139-1203(-)
MGEVALNVVEARNLSGEDRNSYCIVKCENVKEKTDVVESNICPFWNQNFKFKVSGSEKAVTIEVWDKGFMGGDFLGQVSVPFTDNGKAKWYPLQSRGKKGEEISGDLKVKIIVTGSIAQVAKSDLAASSKPRNLEDDPNLDPMERQTRQNIREAEGIAKDSKQTMARVLQKLDETEQIATNTNETLNRQGEQIRGIQSKVDGMQDNMDSVDENVKKIDSLGYSIFRHFAPQKKKDARDTNAELDKKYAKQEKEKEKEQAKGSRGGGEVDASGRSKQNHPKELRVLSDEARQDVEETDEMIDQAGAAVGRLKNLAQAMGTELDKQNDQLGQLHTDVTTTNDRVQKSTRKVNKLAN